MNALRTVRLALAALVCLVFAGSTAAEAQKAVTLLLTDLWTTATPPGADTVSGYMTITNSGQEADRLISATSPLASTVMLHQMQLQNGVAAMRMVDAIEIPAGGTVKLEPTGFHIMFVGVTKSLKEGDEMPVTLTFARVGKIETYLHVLAVGSRGPQSPNGGRSL
jgi:copper(I)-binding protein